MQMSRSSSAANWTVVAVLTADLAFEQSLRSTFGASGAIELRVVPGTLASVDEFDSPVWHALIPRRAASGPTMPQRG